MLAKVSDTYDELVTNSLNRLNALMGPVLLLFVAAMVVLVLLSTLLPLMQLTKLL
jgi:type II secretory pathway component PulF